MPFLVVLAASADGGGWAQVTIGLRPLAAMRRKLAAIGSGEAVDWAKDFPMKCCRWHAKSTRCSTRANGKSRRRAPVLPISRTD